MNINRDIIVLASPELAKLPNWVVGLLAAGGLAAALSTAAGLLLVISTSISHDLLKKGFKPNMTDRQELLAARLAAIVAIVGAGYRVLTLRASQGGRRVAFGLAFPSSLPSSWVFSEDEQRRCYRRYGCRYRIYSCIHHLLQVH